MANVLTNSQNYTDIANAIRYKKGVSTQYLPSEMAEAIRSIETGGGRCPRGNFYGSFDIHSLQLTWSSTAVIEEA